MSVIRKTLKDFLFKNSDRFVIRQLRYFLLFMDGLAEIGQARFFFQRQQDDFYCCLPQFLGIGAQKAATTWVDKVLRQHPALCLPTGRKELHFFDSNYWKGWHWYAWHFRKGKGRIKGEITPSYSILSEDQIREIVTALPSVKLILILRNPIERAWSMASMDLAKHRFRDLPLIDIGEFMSHIDTGESIERGRYSSIIDRWSAAVGRENLFIGFYDEILESPVCFTERLFEFLGVNLEEMDWSRSDLMRWENTTGYVIPDAVRARLTDLYRKEIIELNNKLGHRVTQQWVRDLHINNAP